MKKVILKILLILTILCVLVIVIGAVILWYQNWTNGEIVSAGEQRRYLLYVPSTYDPQKPTPLVITLHGFADWPAHTMDMSGWNQLAEEDGFIVVYPLGTGFPRRWRAFEGSEAAGGPMQDVTFISDLIDKLQAEYNIDPRRIYANGLSNGAGMSFTLACKLADRIAAMGGVAGAYVLPWSECNPGRPVPVIAFHGDADKIVPYTGGPSTRYYFGFPSIPDWAATWARHNGCDEAPLDLPTTGEVSGVRYTSCDRDADVILYTIHGGGHSWPGGEPLPKAIVGHTTPDINATRVMWEFFTRHPVQD